MNFINLDISHICKYLFNFKKNKHKKQHCGQLYQPVMDKEEHPLDLGNHLLSIREEKLRLVMLNSFKRF